MPYAILINWFRNQFAYTATKCANKQYIHFSACQRAKDVLSDKDKNKQNNVSHKQLKTLLLAISSLAAGAARKPIFLLNATLMIPNVSVKPTLEEIQEALVLAGRLISGLSKGVAQWTGGKGSRVRYLHILLRETPGWVDSLQIDPDFPVG